MLSRHSVGTKLNDNMLINTRIQDANSDVLQAILIGHYP